MKKQIASIIFQLAFLVTIITACRKEPVNVVLTHNNYLFTAIIHSFTFGPPYNSVDTIQYSGSVEYYDQEPLKINYLDNKSLYAFVDDTGSLTNCALVEAGNNSSIYVYGTFKNDNELHFYYHVNYGDHGSGADYNVLGMKE
jgi:hypothetical protein